MNFLLLFPIDINTVYMIKAVVRLPATGDIKNDKTFVFITI